VSDLLRLDALVAPLRADVVSGASVIGRTAAEVVRRGLSVSTARDVSGLRVMLTELCLAILEAQPAMAPLVALAARVLASLQGAESLKEGKERVRQVVQGFRSELEAAAGRVAHHADPLLSAGSTILTLSSSSTVTVALERFGRERSLEVLCLESRPMREGAQLAGKLARAGLSVTVAVDAAAGSLMEQADAVLLGADSVGDRGIVNKVGSRAIVSLAREEGVPVHILMDRTKLLPPSFPQPLDDDRPGDEVMEGVDGVQVWNRYFELIPVDSVASIVTDVGTSSPDEVQEYRSRIQVPPELRAWARSRAERP
jgi:translation initiation factor 2B subunit (eIF-2B alpha/beta/delta family)